MIMDEAYLLLPFILDEVVFVCKGGTVVVGHLSACTGNGQWQDAVESIG